MNDRVTIIPAGLLRFGDTNRLRSGVTHLCGLESKHMQYVNDTRK